MPRLSNSLLLSLTSIILLLAWSVAARSQTQLPAPRSRVLQAVDDAHAITLSGNVPPLARPEFDQGTLADSTPLRRMILLLQRSPEQESALEQLIDQQQDKTSSIYHQWLTPGTFGAAFGPTDRDLSFVTAWLSSHGFTSIQVNAARTRIEFNGTAGMVHTAFGSSMHRYTFQGTPRFANASDPTIPAALLPVVAGIASLNNFPRRAASRKVGNFRRDAATHRTMRIPDQIQPESINSPAFTINDGGKNFYGVTPYDFATIYNLTPLWNASTPIDGTGQTIAIVGQTDINPADFVNFRRLFNLPLGNTATPTGTQYLNIIYNGPNPGINGDEGEADIDTQWSGAVAKGATIDYVVSQGTEVMQGTDLSAIYIVDNNLAPVMSYSYGQCELFLGTSGNAFYKNLWQQAAAQGITVLVASGDSGAAGCDIAGVAAASDGLAINGLASTPYNIAVGGTDFYMPNGGGAYWSSANNVGTEASAKGYVPETPWNESCSNSEFNTSGIFSGQTPEQVCNNGAAVGEGLLTVVGAGGGPSTCIQSGNSAASCRGGYPKPTWQTGTGIPGDGVRDIPDVSLFSSSGFFGAFYVVCQQSTNADLQPCSLSAPSYDFAGYGGTSVSTPAFAGILSLVNQKTGSRQGNANYVLYNLAGQQSKAGIACTSITGVPAAGCVFNDVTTDTIAMPCVKGTPNCTVAFSSDQYGIVSGYGSTAGYDLATGLGSVNAANLINNWSNASFMASATTLTLSQSSIIHGSEVSAIVNVVSSTTGTPTGNVSINALASNGSLQNGTLQNGSFAGSLGSFPGGSYSVQAHYAGDGIYAPSDSNSLNLTVSPEPSSITLHSLLYNPSTGAATNVASGVTYPYGGIFLIRADVAGASGLGSATGNILLTDSGMSLDGGVFRLNSTSNTEDEARALTPGTHVIAAVYSGDASFNASTSSPFTINVTKGQTVSGLQVSLPVLSAARVLTLSAQVSARGFGAGGEQGFGAVGPSGTITFSCGGLNFGVGTLRQNTYPASSTDSAIATITIPANLLPIGNNAVTVNYLGDANYNPSTSSAVTVTVTGSTQVASTTVLSSLTAVVSPGGPYSFTATVLPVLSQPGSPLPTGTITLLADGQPVGTPAILSSGVASITGSAIAVAPGSHLINIIYSGDTNYQSSISTSAVFIVLLAAVPSITTISVAPSSTVQGSVVHIVASISPVSPVPNGTAQLMLDGNLFGAPSPVTGATTILPLATNTLQAGNHILQAIYFGDSNHLGSTSGTADLTILVPTGAFTLSPATSTATAMQGRMSTPVTLTASPTAGFHSTITFACTGGLPSGAACSFTPSSVTPSGSSSETTVLTIASATSSPKLTQAVSRKLSPSISVTLAAFLIFFFPRRTRRWSALTLLFVFSTLSLINLSGCGSGGVDPNGPSPGALSVGAYTVTVTAIGGSTIRTAAINLTIE